MKVSFCDLQRQYHPIKKEIDSAINRVISSGWYVLGREVGDFENRFADYCTSKFAIGVGSGTEALHVSLLAAGVGHGDEVITVGNAGVPMVTAILLAGAKAVFVDINPESYTIDTGKIEKAITRKTKAIIPVHLYGQCADMGTILKIAAKRGLKIIEDACQAHGASYGQKKAGTLGDIGAFSFYPTKNLGCYGDGGMIITDNRALAKRAKMLRDYGQVERYRHVLKGINSRLDEIQAAVLNAKLRHLDNWNRKRIDIARIYDRRITNTLITKPEEMEYGTHVYHLYVVACKYRDRLKKYLASKGIQTIVHYPAAVWRQKAYAEFRVAGSPMTERYSRMVLSLPLYPEMTGAEIEYVCDAINGFRL